MQALTKRFVAVADDSYRLETGKDVESRFFRKIFALSHHGQSSQGTYVFTPGGTLLASIGDSHNPRIVAETLQKALEKWNALSKREQLSGSGSAEIIRAKAIPPPGQDRYPAGGLVLRCSYRDLPRKSRHKWADRRNEDFAWFTKHEARQFLPSAPRVGQRYEVPVELVSRLAQFHLVDRVRGEVGYFAKEHVRKAQITVHVTKVRRSLISVELKGETHTSAQGMWGVKGPQNRTRQTRGYRARLLGHAVYSLQERKFVSFEMVALGTRWGGTEYNFRYDDLEPSPLGVAFTLAGTGPLERLPPGLLWAYGR